MLKIAICDDDKLQCAGLEKVVLEDALTNNIKVEIEVFSTGDALIGHIQQGYAFDLIFLDIELGNKTGIEVGQYIRQVFDDHISKIVFMSSHSGYERDLFDVQPMNFLSKPIDPTKVSNCIRLALKVTSQEKKVFKYQVGHSFKQMPFKNILYFENKLRKIEIVTDKGTDVFYGKMATVREQLPEIFITPHTSYSVNYNAIEVIGGQSIKMKDGKEIPISRANIKAIHDLQMRLIKEL